jgi:hypothetical protein
MELTISPKRTGAILLTIIAILAALHIAQLIAYYVINDPNRFDFIELVDFDYEANLPSLYSVFAIILCACVLFMIASGKNKTRQPCRFHWQLLAWIFLFLGLDEGASLHEDIGDIIEEFFTASGYLYFPWVIPYAGLVVLLALFYFRFLLHLPRPVMARFIVAGGLFLTGAVGLEMISAHEADINGTTTITYSVLYTIEELCEMIAIVIFLQALLEYYATEFGTLTIKLSEKQG